MVSGFMRSSLIGFRMISFAVVLNYVFRRRLRKLWREWRPSQFLVLLLVLKLLAGIAHKAHLFVSEVACVLVNKGVGVLEHPLVVDHFFLKFNEVIQKPLEPPPTVGQRRLGTLIHVLGVFD